MKLIKSVVKAYGIQKIKHRRTVRSNYLSDVLKKQDTTFLTDGNSQFIQYIPGKSRQCDWISEQTIEANRLQSYRDPAQKELSEWIRFSGKEAEKYCDGLTTAGMEIDGIPGWFVRRSAARNFYGKANVMKKGFREQNIEKISEQVTEGAGWLVITSNDDSVASLLETGKRLQRLFLKIREKNIGIHPMTQILEEPKTNQIFTSSMEINNPVQFILRIGYLRNYPEPVSFRRPVERFIKVLKIDNICTSEQN